MIQIIESLFFVAILSAFIIQYWKNRSRIIPLSVNYFFHRKCNYQCKFCFHTAKTSDCLPLAKAKQGLFLLSMEGMKKINFSGGEPFLKATYLGELVKYCKVELKCESVTIVSNGSMIKEEWFQKYGQYLDIIAISCDSFNEQTLRDIGRFQKGKDHLNQLKNIKQWCDQYDVRFKLNTVVNSCNKNEDMSEFIQQLKPCRWKVFQCLLIDGENAGENALRDAKSMLVTDKEFEKFVERHKHFKVMIPENNEVMKDSYLNLDEQMRFLNCQKGGKEPTESIFTVGVQKALAKAGFDEKAFYKRNGKYEWSKKKQKLEW